MSPGAVDPAILKCGSSKCRRYTRSALLLLRDEELSRRKPECLNDKRIRPLFLWKIPPPTSQSFKKDNNAFPPRKQFTIMPAFAARHMGGSANFESSFHKSSSFSRDGGGGGNGGSSDDRRMMFDHFEGPHQQHSSSSSSSTNQGLWNRNNHPMGHRSISGGGGLSGNSFFNDNKNFMDNNMSRGLPMRRMERSSDHGLQQDTSRYNDEPEWMNCGPTSRLDVIELRGFDESDGEEQDHKKKEMKKGNLELLEENKEDISATTMMTATGSGESSPPARSTPTKMKPNKAAEECENNNQNPKMNQESKSENGAGHSTNNSSTEEKTNDDPKLDFNFDFLTDESMTSILGQERSGSNTTADKSSKGHIWFADELPNYRGGNGEQSTSNAENNKLMEFFLRGKQMRAMTNPGGVFPPGAGVNMDKFPGVNEIEARILQPDGNRGDPNLQLNPSAAPFIKKEIRGGGGGGGGGVGGVGVSNEQAEFVKNIYSKIQANNQSASAMAANMNVIKNLQQQYQQQQMQQKAAQQNQFQQQMRGNSDLLRTPEAQVLLQGLASGQFTYPSLFQQLNQPNKRSTEIIGTVLSYVNTPAGRNYIQLIQQLSNSNEQQSSTSPNVASNVIKSLHQFQQMQQRVAVAQQQNVQFQNQQQQQQLRANNEMMRNPDTPSPSGQGKMPTTFELQQYTEGIMLEAMKRKRQQEMLKMKAAVENNGRNGVNLDFLTNPQQQPQPQQQQQQFAHRFPMQTQQQQQPPPNLINGLFNQQQQSNLNSLILAKNSMMQNEMMQHPQVPQQHAPPPPAPHGINMQQMNPQQVQQFAAVLQQQQQQQRQVQQPGSGPMPPTQQQQMNPGSNNMQPMNNPFMGRPILKNSIGSVNCPPADTK